MECTRVDRTKQKRADVVLSREVTEKVYAKESGKLIWDRESLLHSGAIRNAGIVEGRLVASMGSGQYQFAVSKSREFV